MKLKITDKPGVTLKTAGKYCSEDIGVTIDESLLGGGENIIQKLIDINNSCSYLFYDKKEITDYEINSILETLNLSQVTSMEYMFYGNENITKVPNLDTSKCTKLTGLFQNCRLLIEVPNLDTSKCTSFVNMFANCESLIEVTNLDTSKCTNLANMFAYCGKIETIETIDLQNMTYIQDGVFINCYNLTNLKIINIKANLLVGNGYYATLLTVDSLVGLCKECIKQRSSRKLTIGSGNIEKLDNVYVKFTDSTQTEIAVGEKGEVEVCESTDTGAMLIKDYMTLKRWDLA